MKKTKHGGKRLNAGRPAKPPTKTIAYRVPLDKAVKIDAAIRKIISEKTQAG